MRVGIIARMDKYEENRPFHEYVYLDRWFKDIFDELDVLLIPIISDKNIEEVVGLCDALIITGSTNDIYPEYYGQKLVSGKELKYDEYPFVKKVVETFNEKKKPILGICAGLQEINVIFGGTLNQLIENHNLRDHSKHKVNLDKDSFLYDVYRQDSIEVNSYHRQSIKDLATGFKVVALSEDGIIEGIEKDNIIAVQWHPESLLDIHLFDEFLKKAGK